MFSVSTTSTRRRDPIAPHRAVTATDSDPAFRSPAGEALRRLEAAQTVQLRRGLAGAVLHRLGHGLAAGFVVLAGTRLRRRIPVAALAECPPPIAEGGRRKRFLRTFAW